jgi:C4-dicarboxylate transporter DctM subunit
MLLTWLAPGFTGNPRENDMPVLGTGQLIWKSAPIVLLVVLVLGGIYGGFFTPTEAGGVGALGALIIAMIKGRLGLRELGRILLETGQVTASITFLLIAAHMYSRLLALTGLPGAMADLLEVYNLGLIAVLILYLIAIILLGTILDSASILLILVPLILPVVMPFGVDLVWFGIITIIAVEVGLLTPPLGVACFVIKSNLDDRRIGLTDIFAGAGPFAVVMVLMTALVLAVPDLALFLVR